MFLEASVPYFTLFFYVYTPDTNICFKLLCAALLEMFSRVVPSSYSIKSLSPQRVQMMVIPVTNGRPNGLRKQVSSQPINHGNAPKSAP